MTDYTPTLEPVFELYVDCGDPVPTGRVRTGMSMMIPILGGTIRGPRLTGEVVPGGADWSVMSDDSISFVDARYAIKAEDGTIIQVFNRGANRIVRDNPEAPLILLTSPRFVAPEGDHDWLNHGAFVGTLTPQAPGENFSVRIGIFRAV